MVPLAIFPVGFRLVGSQLSKTLVSVRSYVGSELRAVFGPVILPGTLPLFLGYTIWSLFFQFNDVICHLVPIGTPTPLMPIILLTLLGSLAPRLGGIVLGFLFIGLILLLILEVGVACVQAYVFTVLRSLFLRESCRPRFDLEGK